MSAKIGALFVDMALNTAAFASDLGKTTNNMKSWASSTNKTLAGVVNGYRSLSREITGMTSGVFTLRNAILGLVGGGAFGALIKSQLDASSAVVDTADNIGITTKALQEYTYIASQSDVATDQLQQSFKIFATSLGQARAGAGRLYSFLRDSNPVLLQQLLSSKNLDDALNILLGTMGKMTNEQSQLALAGAAFGKANTNLVNITLGGAAAMEALRQKAHDLGLVLDEDVLRKSEEAGDKVETLSRVFKAQLQVAIGDNAVAIGDFATELTNLIPKVISLSTEFLKFANHLLDSDAIMTQVGASVATIGIRAQQVFAVLSGGITRTAKESADEVQRLNSLADAVADQAMERMQGIEDQRKQMSVAPTGGASAAGGGGITTLEEEAKRQADAAKEAESSFTKLKAAADRIKQDGQSPFTNYINDVAELDKMLKANLITWGEYQEAVRNAQEKNFHTTERVKKILGDTQTDQEKFAEKMKEINALRGVQGGLSEEQYAQAISKTTAELRKAQMEGSLFGEVIDKAVDGNIKSFKDLGAVIIDWGNTLVKQMLRGQQVGGFGGGSGGGGIFGGLASLFNSGLGGGGESLPWLQQETLPWLQAGVAHMGGMVGSAGASRRVNPGVFAGASRFHNGGLVGGEVPIIAKKGERVLTEQQQKGMGATTVNVYNNTNSNVSTRESNQAGGGKVLEIMIDEITAKNVRRPGSNTQRALSDSFSISKQLTSR